MDDDVGAQGEESVLVAFRWDGFSPSLVFSRPGSFAAEPAPLSPGDHLGLRIGGERFCAGIVSSGGREPCPGGRRALDRFSMCGECAARVYGRPSCVFEPACDGDRCDTDFCSRPHGVYLAVFNTGTAGRGGALKVGMTSLRRLRTRQIEQGVDAYALLARAGNRREARAVERMLSRGLRLPQSVRGSLKLAGLREEVCHVRLLSRARTVLMAARNLSGREPEEPVVLDGYPVPATIRERILPLDGTGEPGGAGSRRGRGKARDVSVSGEVVGIKGSLLILRDPGGALRWMRPADHVGRRVTRL